MQSKNLIEFGSASVELGPLPIKPGWILEGDPRTRYKILSISADRTARTLIWDCTAGRFNWFYDQDETVYVLEGAVVIKDSGGIRKVSAGETIFFPAGSHAEWTVDQYIRKIAFLRAPVPKYALLSIRIVRVLRRLSGLGPKKGDAPPM